MDTSSAHTGFNINRSGGGDGGDRDDDDEDDLLLATTQACEKGLAESEAKRCPVIKAPGWVNTESRWVKFMKWAAHLPGKDKPMLYKAGLAPVTKAVEKRLRNREVAKENRRLRAGEMHRSAREDAGRDSEVARQRRPVEGRERTVWSQSRRKRHWTSTAHAGGDICTTVPVSSRWDAMGRRASMVSDFQAHSGTLWPRQYDGSTL